MSSSEWEFPPNDAAVLYANAEAADSTPGAQPSDWAQDFEPDEGESEEMFEDLSPENKEVIIPNGRSTPIARRNFLALKQSLDTSDAEGMAPPPVSVPRNASKGPSSPRPSCCQGGEESGCSNSTLA